MGFWSLLDTRKYLIKLNWYTRNEVRSSFQCLDIIYDDMFQVLITSLNQSLKFTIHREYSHTHRPPHVVTTDPWDTCSRELTTPCDPPPPHKYKLFPAHKYNVFFGCSIFIDSWNIFLDLRSWTKYWWPRITLKETIQEKGPSFLQCCWLNHFYQNCNILWKTLLPMTLAG